MATQSASDKPAEKAGKPETKQLTNKKSSWSIPWGMVVTAAALVALLYFGLPMWNKKQAPKPAPVTTTETVKDGIRESLKLEFGTVHRTVQMKAPPKVTWEKSAIDPNLRFPIDQDGDLVLGKSADEPPQAIDPQPGYRWAKVDTADKAPARWKGAVRDTGRVWGIVPAAL